ncbi:type 2 isopentenyl-diphosphate Delta-isomerase [Convivina praedatoris]|uniref:Isopentenyl-diphosphate delta-isomerase n=1 Tax=Convivina praedatoris TaxID=2880963 RepID=A0ABM9D3Z9_9LACO|nr:type 2 isopentenyl-diphosphate Delta-isomerase [Convivina sp. LMG 32447]CAH1853413.1 Isopentenyl-diphosphate delta-isomerase [Convivina sp. LMG 32447]CAH1854795.1 Isopentenyl-diphosphate delta-isomerase [Convivina sp. LMG 32447]CAH1855011.1 Isopentenyl-diphosphate delta-isomerase [Convivina sp. LMG 32447]
MESQQAQRKNEHLSLAVKMWRQQQLKVIGAPFEAVRWVPNSLPELGENDITLNQTISGLNFSWPFYIEAMTGGSNYTKEINGQLAQVASETGIAMAVGSQSIAIKDRQVTDSFKIVRQANPNGIVIANLGANHPLDHVLQAVDMLEANALEMHVNVAQELSMAEGDRTFYWLDNLANIIAKSPVPVIIKEVGFGMGTSSIQQIAALEPAAINIGGTNGTNFATIEQARDLKNSNPIDFSHYGFSTIESLLAAQKAQISIPIIATGGITKPNDIITSLILGATLTSSAGYFLSTLVTQGPTGLYQTITDWQKALPKFMLALGVRQVNELRAVPRIYNSDLQNFIHQL